MIRKFEAARRLFQWRALRCSPQPCKLCGFPLLLKFGNNEHAIRCLRCKANPPAMSLAAVLRQLFPSLHTCAVYEMSSRGPFFRFLRENTPTLTFSEYFDDVQPGQRRNGILCQDVQKLTFPDQSFDLCTSTDVLEHVPDDTAAFAELFRVLKPGGYLVFTVPLNTHEKTRERARLTHGQVEHLLPPEFHDDHLRGREKVLCYRNYGADITDRIRGQGFEQVDITIPEKALWWGYGRPVIIARRGFPPE